MSLPAEVQTIQVTGKVLHSDATGTPAKGSVTFLQPYVLRDANGNVVLTPATYVATLDGTGSFTITLPSTNSPNLDPTGFTYQISVETDAWRQFFYGAIPYNAGSPYPFVSIVPTAATSGTVPPTTTANMRYRGAWAPSTGYAVNDVVTYAGGTFLVATGFTSGTVFALANLTNLNNPPGVFNVKWYGAQGDGVTDDTAAFNATVAAAYAAGVANGTYYGVVSVPPAQYLLSAATTKTVTNKGNSQIPIPIHPVASPKFTLVFRGVPDASALPHWQQTAAQKTGSVLVSTLTGLAVDGTFGAPSVIGGPTAQQGYGVGSALFNNVLVVVDGLSIVVPPNPTIMGLNFSGMAEANIITAAVNATTTPGSGLPALCTQSWAYGVYMPQILNNDKCVIHNFSVEGMYAGLVLSEHSVVLNAQAIYCFIGIDCLGNASDSIWIGYASVEACVYDLQCEQIAGGTGCNVSVGILDVEDNANAPYATVATINDPSNLLLGEINVRRLNSVPAQGADPLIAGAANVRVINLSRRTGNLAAPAVPASTVAATKIYRDAAVTVIGGTVTAITVDGVAVGVTSGLVFVPSGRTIAITYSVAPTWTWTLL